MLLRSHARLNITCIKLNFQKLHFSHNRLLIGRWGVWQNHHLLLPLFSPILILLLLFLLPLLFFLLLLHGCSVESWAICLLRRGSVNSAQLQTHHIQQIRTAYCIKDRYGQQYFQTYPGPGLLYVNLSQELVAHDPTGSSQLLIAVFINLIILYTI